MAAIREREIKQQIKHEGANKVATHLVECMETGKLSYQDMPGIRVLWENFITDKKDDKIAAGKEFLSESISEEAGTYTSSDAFSTITSQIFFNALTTRYNSAEFNVSPEFRVIPSTLFRGEKFGGIANINTLLAPVAEGRELPALEPTEDYSESPAQLRTGAIVNLTVQMVKGDRTGEVMNMFEKLGEAAGVQREMEAVSTLTGLSLGGAVNGTRTQYKWKGTQYPTYQTATPWINDVTSNPLVGPLSLNTVWTTLANILDPYTGLPIITPPNPWVLFVTPQNQFTAQRIARQSQYRFVSTPSSGDYEWSIAEGEAGLPVTFKVVASKYLNYILSQNSQPTSNWYFGVPGAAFSWQRAMDITMAEALPNAGHMFTRGLAASYKFEKYETSYVFDPRFIARSAA